MCWSEGASLGMAGLGLAATVITARRGEPKAIPVTLAFFTVMELLQVGGYMVIDQCALPSNKAWAMLSYLHISLQPIFINAFGLALVAGPVSRRMKVFVYSMTTLAFVLMMLTLVPFEWAGQCQEGAVLCGLEWCTISGNWHQGWTVPLNDMWNALTGSFFAGLLQFPPYMLAAFVLPLIYGAWRLALYHLVLGPVLASFLTDNPNEMPAIWCLFSVGLILIGLTPWVRKSVRPGQAVA